MLGVRHLNSFADSDLALALGSRALIVGWMVTHSSSMNEALCSSVYVWHFYFYFLILRKLCCGGGMKVMYILNVLEHSP